MEFCDASSRLVDVKFMSVLMDPTISRRRPREQFFGHVILRMTNHNDMGLSFICDFDVEIIGGSHLLCLMGHVGHLL